VQRKDVFRYHWEGPADGDQFGVFMVLQSPYEAIRDIAHSASAELSVWKAGRSALPAILAEVSRRRLIEKMERFKTGGPLSDDGEVGGKWASIAAHLVEWAFLYGDHESEGTDPTERDVVAAVDLANNWKVVDIALNAGRAGRANITHTKRGFWVDPFSDPRVEVLDLMLEGVDTLAAPVADVGPSLDPATDYLNAMRWDNSEGPATVPRWVMGLFVQHAKNHLRAQPWEVDESTDVGGMTIREAISMLGTLQGISHLGDEVFIRYPSLTMANPAFKRDDLRKMIARYNSNSSNVDRFLDMFTYAGQKGRSPLSAPLIQWGELIVVSRHLLHDSMAERMLLRAASADPSSSGKLGISLGRLCSRWAVRLQEVPGVQVAQEVKVLGPSNRKLGDLDIVALDRSRMQGLIVEAKWPIDARTLSDARKQEDAVDKGRSQVARLRMEVAGGAKVKLPHDWPSFNQVAWHWVVGTARFLDARRTESEIPATSLRLVEQILPVGSLQELIDALDGFSLPREGRDFRLGWKKVRIGRHAIHARTIEMLRPRPTTPPLGRRRADGWT
jgi:hypothetical protein